MKVSKVMTREVRTINPDESIRTAARLMSQIDAGALPVGADDRLVGMITAGTSPCGPSRRARGPTRWCAT